MVVTPLLPLLLLLSLPVGAQNDHGDVVVVPLRALETPPWVDDEPDPWPVRVSNAQVLVGVPDEAGEATVELSATLHLSSNGLVDFALPDASLVLLSVQVGGRRVQVGTAAGAPRLLERLPAGAHRIVVRGVVQTQGRGFQLGLGDLGWVPVRVLARAPAGEEAVVESAIRDAGDPTRWDRTPGTDLAVRWQGVRPPPPRPLLIQVDTAQALRADEAGVEGRADLQVRIINGEVDRLRFRLPAQARDLDASGPSVAGLDRSGDTVTVRLKERVSGSVSLALSWRAPAPKAADGPAPVLEPLDGRGPALVTVVRGDDAVLLPTPGAGLDAVPIRRLPRRARGLVPGRPLVAYAADPGERLTLSWRLLTFSPADTPPTLVDEATYTLALTDEGRVWTRARWQVRNDRNPFLKVTVPEGWRVFGVRVAGQTAEPVRDSAGRLLVPLEKSVETLDGLVAFPVELMLVGEEGAWGKRGERRLRTPAIDAPIAMARWELRLPEDVVPKDILGRPTVVSDWTPDDGKLVIGRGFKKADAPPPASPVDAITEDEAKSEEYWNQAYSAYKSNDFDQAEQLLNQALQFDSTNSAAQQLQRNVNVLTGKARLDKDEELAANRVRELARAKSSNLVVEQARREKSLEKALQAGDSERAQEEAERLLALTERLAALEQTEEVDQKSRLNDYRAQVSQRTSAPKTGDQAPKRKEVVSQQIRFADEEISGELVKPQGQLLLSDDATMADGLQDLKDGELALIFEEEVEEEQVVAEARRRLADRDPPAPAGAQGVVLMGTTGKKRKSGSRRQPAAAPMAVAAPEPPPPPPPPPQSTSVSTATNQPPLEESAAAEEPVLLNREFLQRVPTGRAYQSAVELQVGGGDVAPVEGGVAGGVVGGVVGGVAGGQLRTERTEAPALGGEEANLDLDAVPEPEPKPAPEPVYAPSQDVRTIAAGMELDATVSQEVLVVQSRRAVVNASAASRGGVYAWPDLEANDPSMPPVLPPRSPDQLDAQRLAALRRAAARVDVEALRGHQHWTVEQLLRLSTPEATLWARRATAEDALLRLTRHPTVQRIAPDAVELATRLLEDPRVSGLSAPELEAHSRRVQRLAFGLEALLVSQGEVPPRHGPLSQDPLVQVDRTNQRGFRPHPTDALPQPAYPQGRTPRGRPHPAGPPPEGGFPQRAAPPPAADWGLDIPTNVVASTLSLSLPETGTGLLVEQRLVPSGEPLTLDLTYKTRRRP